MIPLNRPGRLKPTCLGNDYLKIHFPGDFAYYVSTASDALNLAYRKLYEKEGALRIGVSPLACFQAIYPIVVNGHIPVFLDIDCDTFNLDASKLKGRDDIQGLEVIHLGGNPNDMEVILDYAHERGIPIIEDCAQALGATYNGQPLGSFGDYAAFSFIKSLHVPIGGLLLSREDLTTYTQDLSPQDTLIKRYRMLKNVLESKADHRSNNLFNLLYGGLLRLKGNYGGDVNKAINNLEPNDIKEIEYRLGYFELLLSRRIENAESVIQGIDTEKARIQKVTKNGMSNRNRILLQLMDRNAEEVIVYLRGKGIAANNLTQNYLHGFQQHVAKDYLLGKYYRAGELDTYDDIFPSIIAIPSSPFLTKPEIIYIQAQLNAIIS